MKKVLLSVALLTAGFFASAQKFNIYDAADKSSPLNGDAFIFDPGENEFTVDTASSAPYTITAKGVAGEKAYYINGFGNGYYTAEGVAASFGYNAENFVTDHFVIDVFTDGYLMKAKFQFTSFENGEPLEDVYAYEFSLDEAADDFTKIFVPMSEFSKLDGNDPGGVDFLTAEAATGFGKMEIVVVLTGNQGTGPGEIQFREIYIGNDPVGILKPASFSNAFEVYPNPASDLVTFGKVLTNVNVFNAQGQLIENLSSAKTLNVSSYNKGVYFINATEGTSRILVK